MPTSQEIVASAQALIHDHQGDVSAAEIAELFGVSERRSRFYLQKVTGKNLRTLCLEARLAPARPLVRDTDQPIEELAWEIKYGARVKFDAAYQQVFGLSPAADRANARQLTITNHSRYHASKLFLDQLQEQPLRE